MPTVEMLTLANHAEVQNGLLYLCGAEWETVNRSYPANSAPEPVHLGIAVSVVVGWHETNAVHEVSVWIEDEDGRGRPLEVSANLEVGRPRGKPPGSDTRSPFAVTAMVGFPSAGGYRVCAQVDDSMRAYAFNVVDHTVTT